MIEIIGQFNTAKCFATTLDDGAREQLKEVWALRKILCKKKSNQTLPVKRADREILLLIALFPEWERGMRASA